MSLLSPNALDIVLYPDRIALLYTERKLTLRGYRTETFIRNIIPCETPADGSMPWSDAIRTLELSLPSFAKNKPAVNATLSNHFMQYLLVPWFDKMSDEEELVYARHCFRELYGEAADSWSVLASPGRAGVATLASAVDGRLLDDLRGALQRAGLGARSVRPHLMDALNSCQSSLNGRSAWVALLEPGCICLAVLQKGQLAWLRKLRIGEAWSEELAAILQREAFLSDAGVEMSDVFLWAPHLEGSGMPSVGWRKFEHLQPVEKGGHGFVHGAMETFAVEH